MPLTLFQALELEDPEEAEKILKERPEEASTRDAENRTPLHYAAEIANADLFVKVLQADPSLIDSQVCFFEGIFMGLEFVGRHGGNGNILNDEILTFFCMSLRE